MSVEYRIGNRKVSKAQWDKHLEESVKDAAIDGLRQQISQLRCPVHGKAAKLVVGRQTGSKMEMKIEACCDQLLQRAQQALR